VRDRTQTDETKPFIEAGSGQPSPVALPSLLNTADEASDDRYPYQNLHCNIGVAC